MKIVNRCAVTIAPRQPFIDWAQQLRPDQALPPGAFEPGLYEVDGSFQKDLRDAIKDTPLS
jgi:hypothetical protein